MPLANAPDDELIALLDRIGERMRDPSRQRQSELALRQLYDLSSTKLFGLAVRVTGNREWAEDVLQEAYLTIWRSAGDYRASLSPPLAWVLTETPSNFSVVMAGIRLPRGESRGWVGVNPGF